MNNYMNKKGMKNKNNLKRNIPVSNSMKKINPK
jgi:hypothetical protein